MRYRRVVPAARRVWLVGESNPFGSPRYALWPEPPNSSGGRLMRILGHTFEEYVETYERRNLLQLGVGECWPAERARQAAALLLSGGPADGDALVLCGQKVAAAFRVLYELERLPTFVSLAREAGRIPAVVIPHPSGLNRVWNDNPAMQSRVRAAVAGLRGVAR